MLGMSLPPCCRFHPAEVKVPRRSDFGTPCCLRHPVAGSALGSTHFRGHLRVHCRYGPVTRDLPKEDLVDGLQGLGFPPPCHPNYGAPNSAPAGLSPAEHPSLHWTHNRTYRFPVSGSPTGFTARPTAWHVRAGVRDAVGQVPRGQPRRRTDAYRVLPLCAVGRGSRARARRRSGQRHGSAGRRVPWQK